MKGLVQRSRLVLADEPTANLDPAMAQHLGTWLRSDADERTTISVVHDPGLIESVATRVIGLRDGRIACDLPASDFARSTLEHRAR